MKIVLFFVFIVLANCEFDPTTFDWGSVKPLTETKAYRERFPWRHYEDIDEDARVFDRRGRIIRGDIAGSTDFPFAVGLLLSFYGESSWCSASLVSRNFVLTAAQCLIGDDTTGTAMLGASDISRVSEFLMLMGYIKHPSFNERHLDNDIALVRLQRQALINANVQIVRMPNFRQVGSTFELQKVSLSGWGSTERGSNEPIPVQFLSFITSTIITNGSCRLRHLRLRDFHLCSNTEIGMPCTGDEGSPLTTVEFDDLPTQIGIYSWQSETLIRGCERGHPPVYTRLTEYLVWIQDNSDVVIRSGFE